MIFKDNFHNFKEKPQVVATVTTADDLRQLREDAETKASVDILEFRLDNLAKLEQLDLAEEVADSVAPILITARHPAEGGIGDLGAGKRQQLLKRFLPKAAIVDLELRSVRKTYKLRDFVEEAREEGAAVVASMHDFQKMPPMSALRSALKRANEVGVDALKVAVVVETMKDVLNLASWVADSETPISAMGMGPLGKMSRLVLARAGSVLNYGYLNVPNAPGQWKASELRRLIDELFEA
ncbi:MAG: type I 3-dehydroquinate dehydratase [Verrucomicrobiota bacterium]